MSNTTHKRPSAAKRLAAKARLVIHRLLHGVSPTCPRCLCEFTREKRIEYFIGSNYQGGKAFRRVFACDKCGCEFPTGLSVLTKGAAES